MPRLFFPFSVGFPFDESSVMIARMVICSRELVNQCEGATLPHQTTHLRTEPGTEPAAN